MIQKAVQVEGVANVVALEVSNAFNSLPWESIRRAMKVKEVLGYLRAIIHNYLRNRELRYVDQNEKLVKKRRVPQSLFYGRYFETWHTTRYCR